MGGLILCPTKLNSKNCLELIENFGAEKEPMFHKQKHREFAGLKLNCQILFTEKISFSVSGPRTFWANPFNYILSLLSNPDSHCLS